MEGLNLHVDVSLAWMGASQMKRLIIYMPTLASGEDFTVRRMCKP